MYSICGTWECETSGLSLFLGPICNKKEHRETNIDSTKVPLSCFKNDNCKYAFLVYIIGHIGDKIEF